MFGKQQRIIKGNPPTVGGDDGIYLFWGICKNTQVDALDTSIILFLIAKSGLTSIV